VPSGISWSAHAVTGTGGRVGFDAKRR
jgi:hypothetical protein